MIYCGFFVWHHYECIDSTTDDFLVFFKKTMLKTFFTINVEHLIPTESHSTPHNKKI